MTVSNIVDLRHSSVFEVLKIKIKITFTLEICTVKPAKLYN